MIRAAGRLWPLALLLALAVGAHASGLDRELSLAGLERHAGLLHALVAERPLLAPLAFVLAYAAATALSLPGAVFLTLAGGFMFGPWLGAVWSILGATAGATAVFLVARSALGGPLRRRAGPWLARLEAGFRRDAFSYLLVLRLIPLFPFWLVNLVPAFLGMRLPAYIAATALGIVPGAVVYAGLGSGLDALLERGEEPDLGLILEPRLLLPLVGLSLLALLPVAYRRWWRPQPGNL